MKKISFLLFFILIADFLYAQPFMWTQKTPPPFGVNGHYDNASFTINGKIYLATGVDSGQTNTNSECWEYDPASDSWAQKASMPSNGHYGVSTFVISGEGYVVGGWWRSGTNINQAAQSNYKYNATNNSWSSIASFPVLNRYTGVAFEINGKGYFGTGYNPYSDDMWEYDPVANSWTQKANVPAPARQTAVGASMGGYGYLGLGNSGASSFYNDWWRFDPVANNWTSRANFPGNARGSSAVFVMNNEIYLVGGTDYNHTPFQDIYKYSITSDSWSFVGMFPGGPRFAMSEAVVNGTPYIGQGCYSPQTLNEYATTNDWWAYENIAGMPEMNSEKYFSVFPNPFSDYLSINFLDKSSAGKIILYDGGGKLCKSFMAIGRENTFDVSDLKPGVYIAEIFSGKKVFSLKLIRK